MKIETRAPRRHQTPPHGCWLPFSQLTAMLSYFVFLDQNWVVSIKFGSNVGRIDGFSGKRCAIVHTEHLDFLKKGRFTRFECVCQHRWFGQDPDCLETVTGGKIHTEQNGKGFFGKGGVVVVGLCF